MKKEEFLDNIIELLDVDEKITFDTLLKQLDDYDSFALLSIAAYIHKELHVQFKASQLQEIESINQLIQLIGNDKFE
ncbi:MAG: acyl carrier protein [Candidatus Cloacimonetes bacterium]|nr:acyl carrier protein [Candidatus Cloacimonadota bacterium]